MFEKILDYLTMKFDTVYRFRRWWCEQFHTTVSSTRFEGDTTWNREECNRCGFWGECG